MDLIIKVQINGQKLKFLDSSSFHIYDFKKYDNILIMPSFSSDWDKLYKYMVFSSDLFNYTYIPITQNTVTVPKSFIKSPGVAIHVVGKERDEETYNYRLPTNFIKITIGDVKCQY